MAEFFRDTRPFQQAELFPVFVAVLSRTKHEVPVRNNTQLLKKAKQRRVHPTSSWHVVDTVAWILDTVQAALAAGDELYQALEAHTETRVGDRVMVTQAQVPLIVLGATARRKQVLHGRRGHQALAQADGVFFTLSAAAYLTDAWKQQVDGVDDTLVFAVLAHVEEFQFHRVVGDESWELRPFQQSNLTPAVQVVPPLGDNAHFVELIDGRGIGYTPEGWFDGL